MTSAPLVVGEEVADAVAALESTIFSNLGLPDPHNAEAMRRCTAVIRAAGAVPALTAVLDGVWHIGLGDDDAARVLTGHRKVAERDLAVAAAQSWDVGVTTVSATVALAHRAGVEVFATGGIGGVHRGSEVSGDISADLDAIASHPVVTVCAGAKAFLDLPRTLELLETIGVPVLGWRHDWFPAFYTRSSGVRVAHRVETGTEVAKTLRFASRPGSGVLLTAPIPEADELDPAAIDAAIAEALDAAASAGVSGPGVTPFVLERIARATAGGSIPANLALAENNARVAAEVAVALTEL